MSPFLQNQIKQNPKMYNYLMQNSYYFKRLDQGFLDFKQFSSEIKEKYKLRVTDKISSAMDSIELVSSVLDIINNSV